MEEKKLTDEEIVKALECCSNGCRGNSCFGSKIDGIIECTNILSKNALDLIHRLQDEKKELENLCNKTYDDLTKEIERLTEELEKTKDNRNGWRNRAWNDEKVISQLTEKLDKTNAKLIEEYGKNAELQKQVDELKKENNDLLHERQMAFMDGHQQAVKDTAKEISITAIQLSNMCRDFYEFQNRLVDLIEVNYGVKIVRETIIPAKGVEVE